MRQGAQVWGCIYKFQGALQECITRDAVKVKEGEITECNNCRKNCALKNIHDNTVGRCYECEREGGGIVDCEYCGEKDQVWTNEEVMGCEQCPAVACKDWFPDGCDECQNVWLCDKCGLEQYYAKINAFVGRRGRGAFSWSTGLS
jgi:hypothetical protein